MRRRSGSPAPETTIPASVLASGSVSVGRLESEEDLILAGAFEGQLRSSRSVQLLSGSNLQGDVQANEITVQGQVKGNLLARQRIRILVGGNISGEVCAPQVTVEEGVSLNARVRMPSTSEDTREFLVPVLLRTEAGAAPREWTALLDATKELLEPLGFLVETQSRPSTLMRSIFRSRQPLSYGDFRGAMDKVETVLRTGARPAGNGKKSIAHAADVPAALGHAFLRALGDAPEALAIVGITVVRRREASTAGGLAHRIESRRQVLPAVQDETPCPKPADLLLAMQNIQAEVLGEAAYADRVPEA